MDNEKTLKSLTALRFLFFLCVFFSHYVINGARVLPNAGGFAVTFFYMLSGFSLSLGYGDRLAEIGYGSFIKKRLLRLWPMQVVTILIRAIPILLIPLLAGGLEWKNLVSFVLKFFFVEAWIPDTQIVFNFNACAWYLSPLVFCYFLFPCVYKWVSRANTLHVMVAIVAYVAVYFGCIYVIPPAKHQVYLYAAPYFRLFDFTIGIVLFRLFNSCACVALRKRSWAWEFVLLCVLAIVAWLPLKSILPVLKMASIYWLPAAIVLIGFATLERAGGVRMLRCKWLQVFGAASYEMYMTHLFLVSIFQRLDNRFLASDETALKILLLFLCLTCSILMGLAVRRWFNVPVSGYIRKRIL